MRKYIGCFAAALCIVFNSICASAWTDGDIISSKLITDSGFENYEEGEIVWTNGVIDTAFADTEHGKTLKADNNYVRPGYGMLASAIDAGKKIRLEFDYYVEDSDLLLRCELRGISSSEITRESQNDYWDGFEYGVTLSEGQWNTFSAEFDTEALKDNYRSKGTLSSSFTNSYFFLCAETSSQQYKTVYIDNANIFIEGSEDVIVPLQKPAIEYDEAFVIDESVADRNGEYGTVYKALVDVSSAGASSKTAVLSDFKFNEGKYKMSFWFMEDANNSDTMTRMWRPRIGTASNGTTIQPSSGGYMYYSGQANMTPKGEWAYVEMEFEVNSHSFNELLNDGSVITLWWQCASENYTSKNIDGDFYIYIDDLKFFKYPEEDTRFVTAYPGSGEEVAPRDSAAEFEFSLNIDPESIRPENITVNGITQTAGTVICTADENRVIITRESGFAPGKSYEVSVTGVNDSWDRPIEGTFTSRFKTAQYSDFSFIGSFDSGDTAVDIAKASVLKFNVDNKYGSSVDLRLCVIGYDGNSIKKLFTSAPVSLAQAESKEIPVNVSGLGECAKIKAFLWRTDTAGVFALADPINIK